MAKHLACVNAAPCRRCLPARASLNNCLFHGSLQCISQSSYGDHVPLLTLASLPEYVFLAVLLGLPVLMRVSRAVPSFRSLASISASVLVLCFGAVPSSSSFLLPPLFILAAPAPCSCCPCCFSFYPSGSSFLLPLFLLWACPAPCSHRQHPVDHRHEP